MGSDNNSIVGSVRIIFDCDKMKTIGLFLIICGMLPSLGSFDKTYDKSEWHWVNIAGIAVLKHNTIKNCLVGVNKEPAGYEGNAWSIYETLKDFGKTKYCISIIEYNGKLWCVTYTQLENWPSDQLNVYMPDSCWECQKAAEKIIKKHENIQ